MDNWNLGIGSRKNPRYVSRSAFGGLLVLLAAGVCAQDQVWLIGGGDTLRNSQAQIERNVDWARDVVRAAPGARDVSVFFSDGDDPGKDVVEWSPPAESAASLQPLARIYNSYVANGDVFRNHRLRDVAGPATAEHVRRELSNGLARLQRGDRGLLVFNGHGTHGGDAPEDNALALWGRSALSVRDLREILDVAPADVPVRFVFTQCYAGGFTGLVYRKPPGLKLSGAKRCGFVAVAADQEAEGCSPGVDANDYRDYSTYFFAALHGRTRLDEPLEIDPDRNGDGSVDLFEAHLYSLRVARSTDLPRATSEDYLLRWEPWHARLWPVTQQPDNLYRQLARDIADDLGLSGQGAKLLRALRDNRQAVRSQIGRLQGEQQQTRENIDAKQSIIRREVDARWPEAAQGNTLGLRNFFRNHLEQAQTLITTHADYPALVAAQDQYWVLDKAILELQRRLAQLDKIEHLLRVARALEALQTRGSDKYRERYARLRACEALPL